MPCPSPPDARLALAVQTTYSVDEAAEVTARARTRASANVARPAAGDICYATTNRQAAVRAIAARADAMIVAGESFSSNACRLAEVAASAGCPAVQRVTGAEELDWSRLPRTRLARDHRRRLDPGKRRRRDPGGAWRSAIACGSRR